MRVLAPAVIAIIGLYGSIAQASEPREPGFNELIVVEPGTQEDGLPAATISGGHVQIPPTLHIHPYYYAGDKEYQGPIINGGPTIIVANHPKSGEKLYIEAVIPQGAPIISYTAHRITYIFPNRRVFIEFNPLFRHRAKVKYVSGRGLFRSTEEHVAEGVKRVREMKRQSPLAAELSELKKDTGNVIKGSFGVASTATAGVVARVRTITRVLPGVQALQSAGERAEESGALEEIRQAGLQQTEDATNFIRTIR